MVNVDQTSPRPTRSVAVPGRLAGRLVPHGRWLAGRRAASQGRTDRRSPTPSASPSPTPSPTRRSSRARTAGGTPTPPPTRCAPATSRASCTSPGPGTSSTWEYHGTVFNDTNRRLGRADVRSLGAGHPLRRRPLRPLLHRHRHHAQPRRRLGHRRRDRADPGRTVDADRRAGRRAAAGGDGGFLWTIDPAGFTDVDGQRYLYFGGYNGGIWVTKVSADGLTAVGAADAGRHRQPVRGRLRRPPRRLVLPDGLLGRTAAPARPPATRSSPAAPARRWARSSTPTGSRLIASRVGGTTLVTQNGNRWIGAGHHAIATDHAGRDFLVYHAIDRDNAWLEEPFGINRRPMLIDRIDWIDGWPRMRAGAGPSDTAAAGPGRPAAPRASPPPTRRPPASAGCRPGPPTPRPARPHGSGAPPGPRATLTGDTVRLRLDVRGRPAAARSRSAAARSRCVVTRRPGRRAAAVRTGRGARTSRRGRPRSGCRRGGWQHPGGRGRPRPRHWPSSARPTWATRTPRSG